MVHLRDFTELELKTHYTIIDDKYGSYGAAIRLHIDVKTLLNMIKEYEKKRTGEKLHYNDILIILCKEYQEKHNLSLWNPNNPQWKRIERIEVNHDR